MKTPAFSALALECDETLSSFAFNFNLRRYTEALAVLEQRLVLGAPDMKLDEVSFAADALTKLGLTPGAEVGQCWLTPGLTTI